MKKISIKEKEPTEGQKILAYGYWGSEITRDESERSWNYVEYTNKNCGQVIGTDYYCCWVTEIEYWIELNLD